jgi:predicted dehydrogenase
LPTGIGVLGCGNVSRMYLPVLTDMTELEVVAVADIDAERARETAKTYGVAKALTPDELLADADVEVVLNLTSIVAHVETTKAALAAGKHVYSEKPLATSVEDAKALVEEAARRGLALGCAPDTMLGSGFQVARDALLAGEIGRPLAATASMLRAELTKPSFYTKAATPIFDMAPYYVTALVDIFGPATRVSGAARTWPGDTPPPQTEAGASIAVAGTIEFANGGLATLVMAWGTVPTGEVPALNVLGTEGELRFPNPNNFGDPALVTKHGRNGWEQLPGSEQPANIRRNLRGIGVGEMVSAIREGRQPRASGEIACHVVEVIAALVESARTGERIELTTTCRPAAPFSESERAAMVAVQDNKES